MTLTWQAGSMEFHKLLESQVANQEVKSEIQNLLTRKMSGEELNEEPKIQILNDFLEEKIEYYKSYVLSVGPTGQPDTEMLDQLFMETIYEAWNNQQ